MRSELIRSLLALCLLSAAGCDEPEWRPLLPAGKANLVIVFKSDLSPQDINDFLDQELQVPADDGGEWLRPGVDAIVKTSVGDFSAYAVNLDPTSPPEEREAIRNGVKSSPYVYRVFENVAPGDIELGEEPSADAAQDEEESLP